MRAAKEGRWVLVGALVVLAGFFVSSPAQASLPAPDYLASSTSPDLFAQLLEAEARAEAHERELARYALFARVPCGDGFFVGNCAQVRALEGLKTRVWGFDLVPEKQLQASQRFRPENVMVPVVFGFHGRPVDSETGLLYFRNRYYSAELGRFVTTDPMGYVDGPSSYMAFGNNPVNFGDPMGLETAALANEQRRSALTPEERAEEDERTTAMAKGAARGFFKSPWTLVKNIGSAIASPIATAKGLWRAATHPIQTARNALDAFESLPAEEKGEVLGGLYGDTLLSAGVGKAAQTGRSLARFGDDLADAAAEGMRQGAVESVEQLAPRSYPITDPRRLLPAPKDYNPWVEGEPLWSGPAPKGTVVEMAMAPGQVRPGGWATTDMISSVGYVRNELAVRLEFKPQVDAVQLFEVPEGVFLQYGRVGKQAAPEGLLEGGGTQLQILNFADRSKLSPVGPRLRLIE